MTVADLAAYVGAAPNTESFSRPRGDVVETAWRGEVSGVAGWWFAVTRGNRVLAIGWTAGNKRDVALELASAIAKLAPTIERIAKGATC